MAAKNAEIRRKAREAVAKAKTGKEYGCLIAKYIDLIDSGKVDTSDKVKQAELVSAFIGRGISVENVAISYERLSALNGKKYAFAS